ncbi:DHH family phosphoesterase [Bilifractor porci]|uniref:Bifunctional oligoribonuclease/PAP phosphatase NrnA n=1 Tax=Bilifractor porci TaxID=2606636 RepID=A0A7X2TNV2_9FIRM|nr:bifunctional oligoribonuclease/PAP phosphatase NrnA [Bilifractor porci]MST81955.1 bifunctional oligoribonuclease/PAP phosphatase NrnA [Bilifractor porci]
MKQKNIGEFLKGVRIAAVAGHVNPDGDCVGACLGVYNYIRDNFPETDVDVYLQKPRQVFQFMNGFNSIHTELIPGKQYDLLILLDISSRDRIGVAEPLVDAAEKTLCFDHHVTNRGSYSWLFNVPEISSTCELVFSFMDETKVSRNCAECIYTGIVHDTGVFQYSSTSPDTLRAAAKLMEKGVPFSEIIERTFFEKTYVQNQLLGRSLMESILLFNGRLIISYMRQRDMRFYGVTSADMEGIVSQLRNTAGVEVAVFMYETDSEVYKVSLRSRETVDVSEIAQHFGGGGHIRAAGATMQGTPHDVINNLTYYIEKALYPEKE